MVGWRLWESFSNSLVDCLKGVRPTGTKWILKNKKDERGIVIRNKAKLVAQGHTREEGIDYDKVFAPVARIEAIRLFLAYNSFMGFTVSQIDVKSAFLYGTIDEEVYVMQPPRFQDQEFLTRVYKVGKQCMDYIRLLEPGMLCREFEAIMHEKFQMSAMGELNFFLGLQVLQKKDGIFLSQDKSMIGSLMYLTASRPDIMFAVCAYARLQVTPNESYSDSDYGGASQDRKSTIEGCQFLGRRLISWKCKKQTIVATSTTEAEYVAASSGCGQVLWIQNQLLDYGIVTTEEGTKILATVDGKLKTIYESSIRINLKLNDEVGISSLPDAELFENLTLMGYNISPNQKFTFQKGQFSHQ
nr:hypothetical protein [Tanacetum cinerariifolium]